MPDRPTAHIRIPPAQSDDFRQRMRMVHDRLAGSGNAGSQTAARWAGTLLVVALVIFAFFTLFPFNFTLHTGQSFHFQSYDPSDPSDWVMNIILTLPLGFALATFAAGRGWRGKSDWKMFLLAAAGTCLCSTAAECLQLFLPGRVSALADVLSNTTGGIVGCFCFLPFGRDGLHVVNHLARALRHRVVGVRGILVLVAVVGLVCATQAWMLRRPRLATWNSDFPLLLGNENNLKKGESRAWEGTVADLRIANRAATGGEAKKLLVHGDFSAIMGDSVIADYPLIGLGPFPDASHHLPDLKWARQYPKTALITRAYFADGNFISTEIRAGALVNAIVATDSFTISLKETAGALDQTGPARILTCSKNLLVRNFTLGQDNADLIIRLRTRASGDNGTCPEWRVPNVFRDRNPHTLLISYDGGILRVYQDTPARSWRVRTPPEYAVLRPILARDLLTMPINGTGNRRLVILYYAVFLLPIAFILGIFLSSAAAPPISVNPPPPLWQRLILPALGVLFAAAALYVTVDRLGVRAMGWTECPLAAVILAIETAFFGHWWAHGPARHHPEPPMAQVTFVGDVPQGVPPS